MSKNTKYTVVVAGVKGETRSKKASAIELAEQVAQENSDAAVEVVTDAGTVVHTVEPKVEKATGTNAKPWTRTDSSDKLPAEVDGYELAYKRPQVRAGVYRQGKDYLVIQFNADGDEVLREAAANTTEAREITNELAAKHRAARAAEKAADAKAKADAKAAKQAAKEKAQAEKDRIAEAISVGAAEAAVA